MAIYICDPGLTGWRGHHARWDEELVRLFRSEGLSVQVVSHGNFPEKSLAGAPVFNHFSKTVWHFDDRQDLFRNWDAYFSYNQTLFKELELLSRGQFRGKDSERKNLVITKRRAITKGDLVIFPTIVQYQLTGVVKWFNALPEMHRPTVHCFLMAQSGCEINEAKKQVHIHSIDTARFYKLAFREAEQGAPGIEFFSCGETHAKEYSFLRGKEVPPYALLNTAIQPDNPIRETSRQQVLLYAGDDRVEKGAGMLPQMVEKLCPAFPGWHFVVQVNHPKETIDRSQLYQTLDGMARRFENFELKFRRLDDEEYCTLFNDSEVVVVPYRHNSYRHHTSGIVWEGVATANTLVVPEPSWLSSEAERLSAGYTGFLQSTPASVVEAVERAIKEPPKPRAERIAAARKFKARNRPEMLKQQILDAWPDAPEVKSSNQRSA